MVNFPSILHMGINTVKEPISYSMSERQKQILVIVATCLSLIALFFAARWCFMKPTTTKDNVDPTAPAHKSPQKIKRRDDDPIDEPEAEDQIPAHIRDLPVDDKMKQVVDDNFGLIRKDLLSAIKQRKEMYLGKSYDSECEEHPRGTVDKVTRYIATFGFNRDGHIKSLEYGCHSSIDRRHLHVYGDDITTKEVAEDMFIYDKPLLKSTSDALDFCSVKMTFSVHRSNNLLPFAIEEEAKSDRVNQIAYLMVVRLNKSLYSEAVVNFKSLPRPVQDWIV